MTHIASDARRVMRFLGRAALAGGALLLSAPPTRERASGEAATQADTGIVQGAVSKQCQCEPRQRNQHTDTKSSNRRRPLRSRPSHGHASITAVSAVVEQLSDRRCVPATAIRRTAPRRWLPAGLAQTWLYAYAGVWAATLAPAAFVAGVGRPLAVPVRRVLGLALSPHRNSPPDVGHVLALAAHNVPIVSWPLLLGVLGAHRHRQAMHVADGLLLACLVANTLPVGVALGAYGTRLVAYVPQLPLEWGGLALGASGWLLQRKRVLSTGERLGLFVLIVWVLVCAAVLESVAVPHR
jgi:hypothetical protein